jgi:ketosteroid isomerase-like protein
LSDTRVVPGRDEDIATIHRIYEMWANRNWEGFFELLAEDVTWYPPPESFEARVGGREALRSTIDAYNESFEEFRPELEQILVAPQSDRYLALVTIHTKGKGSGAELDIKPGQLFTMRDGKVVEMRVFPNRDDAMAAAGLEGSSA